MIHNIKKQNAQYLKDEQKKQGKEVNGEEKNRFQGIEQVNWRVKKLKSKENIHQWRYIEMKEDKDSPTQNLKSLSYTINQE